MLELAGVEEWMLYGGLLFGLVFGIVLQRSRFCLLSALGNYLLFRDWRHAHAWMIAVAIAIAGVAGLEQSGLVAVSESSFRLSSITLAGTFAGAILFGIGTVLAGGCASRTLIRASEGNFNSLIALACFAGAALVTLFGFIAPLRAYLLTSTQLPVFEYERSVHELLGITPAFAAGGIFFILLSFVIFSGRNARDWSLMLAGGIIGGIVVAVWWFSGYLVQDEFEPTAPFSLSVAGPLARTTLWLGTDTLSASWFSITLILGMLSGGLLSALVSKTYHWVLPEPRHVPHAIGGGLLMGVGSVFAGGCNIGQGLTGVSTLSLSSIVAVFSILLGMRLGMLLIQVEENHHDAIDKSSAQTNKDNVQKLARSTNLELN